MIRSAVTISLVPEARGGPFVFWDDLAASCATAKSFGFDAVEVFASAADALNAKTVRQILEMHQLKLAAMGTGAGWVVHKLRLTAPDALVRRRAQQFVGAIIDFAGAFGAPAIIGSMQGCSDNSVTRADAFACLQEALEQLGPRAHALGVPLLFEPLNRYETNLIRTVDEALELLRPLRTRNVKLLCDLFHMNLEESSIPDALRRAGPLVGHVHFADSNRHAVGFGHTDVGPILGALAEIGYNGYLSAEILPLPDGDTAAAQTMASFRKMVMKG